MRVQTGQLEALHWIVRLGSFRAAAAYLHLSQPTISMRIRELERLLGTPLFDRSGYHVVATAAGREMARYAERILGLAEEMEHRHTAAPAFEGPIRLGAADTFALTCLSDLLARLEELFPALQVDLQIDFSFNLNVRLQRGELDVAFLTGPVDDGTVQVQPLVRQPLAWIASPRLALPNRVLGPPDIGAQAIITNPRPSHLYRTIREWFAAAGCAPHRVMTCNSLTIMARLAIGGHGVTLLPPAILRSEFELGTLRPLPTDPPIGAHDLLLAYRPSLPTSIMGAIREIGSQLVHTSGLGQIALDWNRSDSRSV